ncbi:unnamed protein product [Amoebophrya sp. A25]|nr:unnamed protein product [Amoebophrya sp. A25]|eukprot:GSA25T00002276001.1
MPPFARASCSAFSSSSQALVSRRACGGLFRIGASSSSSSGFSRNREFGILLSRPTYLGFASGRNQRTLMTVTRAAQQKLSPVFGGTPWDGFGVHNLPYGVFSTPGGSGGQTRIGVAVGSKILDCSVLADHGVLPSCLKCATLNDFMAQPKSVWNEVRTTLQEVVTDFDQFSTKHKIDGGVLVDRTIATMHLPCHIGDYTDFYASREHATNVGMMFRDPAKALLPNWLHLPVGYHGRASSVLVSPQSVVRPKGQAVAKDAPEGPPSFGPSKLVDFELEVGAFVGGPPMQIGETLTLQEAEDRLFGLVLLNDWSARDLQKWEYVPLGPFTAKNFGTIISPWVVPLAALEKFRVPTPAQVDPVPLPYLRQAEGTKGNVDLSLSVTLESGSSGRKKKVTESNLKYMYWSLAQQLCHHASGGCNMQPGDLIGTGTISGPGAGERGCLLEITWAGRDEVDMGGGETRKFLQDGDTCIISGMAASDSEEEGVRINFGECVSKVLPATHKFF